MVTQRRSTSVEPLLSAAFLEYAQARGFVIDPTRVRKAKKMCSTSWCRTTPRRSSPRLTRLTIDHRQRCRNCHQIAEGTDCVKKLNQFGYISSNNVAEPTRRPQQQDHATRLASTRANAFRSRSLTSTAHASSTSRWLALSRLASIFAASPARWASDSVSGCSKFRRVSAPMKPRAARPPWNRALCDPLPTGCPNLVDSRRLTSTSGEKDPNPFRFQFHGVGSQYRVPQRVCANTVPRVRIPPSP
jgi:hypothetical protein